jgi:hypothetical protein
MQSIERVVLVWLRRVPAVFGQLLALFLTLRAVVDELLAELVAERGARNLRGSQRGVLRDGRMHHALVGIVVFLVVATVLAVAGIEIVQNADIGTSIGAGIVSGGLLFVAICVALLFYFVGKRAARHQL